MAYVASNYVALAAALSDTWVCSRASGLGSYEKASPPPDKVRHGPNFCGQCVSLVTRMCPTIPVATAAWKKGALVSTATDIAAGTAIATFGEDGSYSGHAAIFVSKTPAGINVIDQWITGAGKPVGPRLIRYNGHGVSNNGSLFHVID